MKWAAYSPDHGWLVDLCVGPLWTWDIHESTWFDGDSQLDAEHRMDEALKAADAPTRAELGIMMVLTKGKCTVRVIE